ncbi:hypothetical protein J5N97_016843 [Dioscorea zingiberensis]|uniref:Uncharacterized protein n=1 Tax=Dioscorea zingiberensis TaxID=325984 RepID=A0A9D5CK79_9LILI|nr:hypothetical protein J5N97_016843 [Dioscorea zingiberensis]
MAEEMNTPALNGAPTSTIEAPLGQSNMVVLPEERFHAMERQLAALTTTIMAVERHVSQATVPPPVPPPPASPERPSVRSPARQGHSPRRSPRRRRSLASSSESSDPPRQRRVDFHHHSVGVRERRHRSYSRSPPRRPHQGHNSPRFQSQRPRSPTLYEARHHSPRYSPPRRYTPPRRRSRSHSPRDLSPRKQWSRHHSPVYHQEHERARRGHLSERERVLRNVPCFRSPFIRAIWEAPFPDKYIPPNIRYYDGTSDPFEHVERYCSEMTVNGTSEREGESLRNYLDEETHGMSDLDSIMVVGAVLDGLRDCPFLDSLTRDVPRDLFEVMSRAQRYIASDEFKAGRKEQTLQRANEFRREENKRGERVPRREADQTHNRPPHPDDRGARDPNRPRIRARYDNYTPLNTSRENIMLQIQDKKILKQPEPIRETSSAKKSGKFCIYHKVQGHTTENCIHLRDAIEDLVREGKLSQFLKQEPTKKEEHPAQPEPPVKKIDLSVIAGGPRYGGETSSSRRSYARMVGTMQELAPQKRS